MATCGACLGGLVLPFWSSMSATCWVLRFSPCWQVSSGFCHQNHTTKPHWLFSRGPVETRTRTMSAAEDTALLEVNLLRETWCRLEAEPRGSTSQRRHFRAHLQTSPALLNALTGQGQRRLAAGRPAPPPGRLLERRHFDESCKVSHDAWQWTKEQEQTAFG